MTIGHVHLSIDNAQTVIGSKWSNIMQLTHISVYHLIAFFHFMPLLLISLYVCSNIFQKCSKNSFLQRVCGVSGSSVLECVCVLLALVMERGQEGCQGFRGSTVSLSGVWTANTHTHIHTERALPVSSIHTQTHS